jgi:hypothetical protein
MNPTENTMNIRAPRTDLNQGSQQTNQVSGDARVKNTSDKTTATSSDTVTFTTTASEMLKLQESLANIPISIILELTPLRHRLPREPTKSTPKKLSTAF